MPYPPRAALALAAAVLALCPRGARAEKDEEHEDSAAMAASRGLRVGFGPTLLMPMHQGGPYGGGLDIDVRYGIKLAPIVIAPGGMAAGYLISRRFIGLAMPTLRVTLPIGPFAPYALGGVGGGWLSNPGDSGLALLVGGGLTIHFGRVIALGAEVKYQEIRGTSFGGFAFGPSIILGG